MSGAPSRISSNHLFDDLSIVFVGDPGNSSLCQVTLFPTGGVLIRLLESSFAFWAFTRPLGSYRDQLRHSGGIRKSETTQTYSFGTLPEGSLRESFKIVTILRMTVLSLDVCDFPRLLDFRATSDHWGLNQTLRSRAALQVNGSLCPTLFMLVLSPLSNHSQGSGLVGLF